MNKADLKRFRGILEGMRDRILANAKLEDREGPETDVANTPNEMDLATLTEDQSFRYRLHDRSVNLLRKIDQAIEKIDSGTFGICEECGEEIAAERLRARPIATLCIDCKEDQEKTERKYTDRADRNRAIIFHHTR